MRLQSHRSAAAPTDWDWAAARTVCLRHARRVLANEADAEEAVQEALARAWRKRGQCREDAVPWMLQITHNEALRIATGRTEHRPLDDAPEASEGSRADEIVERIMMRDELAGLRAADRLLLELRYGADLTQSAVADRAGIPEGTVKVRLHRLRKQLRSALQEAI
jgi:RNA polymerase sigma-70 factor, ECF subfamily